MTYAAILDEIERLKQQVEHLADTDETASLKLTVATCLQALAYAEQAPGLTDDKRKRIRSARRMARAALGMEAA
jgi:hypothetical protein